MTPNRYFSFINFKNAFEVNDIDEATYSLILRNIFAYLRRVHGIDVADEVEYVTTGATTTTEIIVDIDTAIGVGMMLEAGTEYREIVAVINDELVGTTTITLNSALSSIPTSVVINKTIVDFDLQFAIYTHAKYLFESYRKNAYILDSVTDANGNKATYKPKPPTMVEYTYMEYSPNDLALV